MNAGNGMDLRLGGYENMVESRLKQLQGLNFVQRLWDKDEQLWLEGAADSFTLPMGWLTSVGKMQEAIPDLEEFAMHVHRSGIKDVVLLGMGGSSMAPMVFASAFPPGLNGTRLHVIDTTHPGTILRVENKISLPDTLFIISSKSGSTVEIATLFEYFYSKVKAVKGESAGENFIAITDDGSPLAELARKNQFKRTFINLPGIGGRFSALSYFGLVPAALIGIDLRELLSRAQDMATACGPNVPADRNPGVILGTAIAVLSMQGCDKLCYQLHPALKNFGLWIEQLVAESTGKNNKGIFPLDGSSMVLANLRGKDHFLVEMRKGEDSSGQPAIDFPVIVIHINDNLDLGAEFFRWEIATATAGSILGVNAFDQPNVQESKSCTEMLLKQIEGEGKLPEMEPVLSEDGLNYFGQEKEKSGKLLLESFFSHANQGNCIVLQGYLPESEEVIAGLGKIGQGLQKSLSLPVSSQFGPRYLHSTGQYHKGGPNNGFFIQLIGGYELDMPIPGRSYSFGMLNKAQAIGDLQALLQHNRRSMLVDLGLDCIGGLKAFLKVIQSLQSEGKRPERKPYRRKNLQAKMLKPGSV